METIEGPWDLLCRRKPLSAVHFRQTCHVCVHTTEISHNSAAEFNCELVIVLARISQVDILGTVCVCVFVKQVRLGTTCVRPTAPDGNMG